VIRTLPLEVRLSQGQRAGLVSRTAAGLVDLFVGATILVGGYLAVAVTLLVFRPRSFRWPAPGTTALAIVGAAIVIVYLVAGWTTTGRTLGGQVMGLRVIGRDGATLAMGRASVRAILCVLFPIGLLWVAVDRGGRAVHDLLLHTAVVYDWRRRPTLVAPEQRVPKRDPDLSAVPTGGDVVEPHAPDPC
jgi:uncharacterized RDD family membrane protein YckC